MAYRDFYDLARAPVVTRYHVPPRDREASWERRNGHFNEAEMSYLLISYDVRYRRYKNDTEHDFMLRMNRHRAAFRNLIACSTEPLHLQYVVVHFMHDFQYDRLLESEILKLMAVIMGRISHEDADDILYIARVAERGSSIRNFALQMCALLNH